MRKLSLLFAICVLGVAILGVAGAAEKVVTVQIGFENTMQEPIGQALTKWQELVAEKSNGTMKVDIFANSALGNKKDIIDMMLLGEPVITLADGAFYADYGVPDFGIVFGPFLFDDWDQCWALTESDWYAGQSKALEEKGLKILASNWVYGARHTLTTKKVTSPEDLKGLKIRVPANRIQTEGFIALGAAATGMSLGDVYQALQAGVIDGAENPLSTLYGRKLHEVAKHLILDGHVLNFTTWICGTLFFDSLTEEQQEILISAAVEAGIYNNQLAENAEKEYLGMMVAEGVIVTEMTPESQAAFKEAAQSFYSLGDKFGWSENLYETVRKAMGAE